MERQLTCNQEDQNLSIWDQYFLGEGKASRKEFWCTVIILIIMAFIVAFVLLAIFEPQSTAIYVCKMLYRIININVFASVTIRRLHDVGKSGWWYLLILTGVGIIPILYWATIKGKGAKQI